MKRRKFFDKLGKGIAVILTTTAIPPIISGEHKDRTKNKKPVEIKIHQLAVPRKDKNRHG